MFCIDSILSIANTYYISSKKRIKIKQLCTSRAKCRIQRQILNFRIVQKEIKKITSASGEEHGSTTRGIHSVQSNWD